MMNILRRLARTQFSTKKLSFATIALPSCFITLGMVFLLDWALKAKPTPIDPDNSVNHAHTMVSMASAASLNNRRMGDAVTQFNRVIDTGKPAPEFKLPAIDGGKPISLSDFRGRPVVMACGSMTCNIFVSRIAELNRLHEHHKEQAEFLFVNVTEAHHRIPKLEFMLDGPPIETIDERRPKIVKAMEQMSFSYRGAIDIGIAAGRDSVEVSYDSYPLRLIAIDVDGRIAKDFGRSMFTPWNLDELEKWFAAQPMKTEDDE